MSSAISRAAIFDVVNHYIVPGVQVTLIQLKSIQSIEVEESKVILKLVLMDAYKDREKTIQQDLEQRILQVAGVSHVQVLFQWQPTPQVEFRHLIPTVKRCVVIGSGKGGVGKSTVASNLAVASARQGLKVGLLDADLYGPSMGMMFGITEKPEGTDDGKIKPIENWGTNKIFILNEQKEKIKDFAIPKETGFDLQKIKYIRIDITIEASGLLEISNIDTENLKISESLNGLVTKISDSSNKVITLKSDYFEGELKDKFGFKSVYYQLEGTKFKSIKVSS